MCSTDLIGCLHWLTQSSTNEELCGQFGSFVVRLWLERVRKQTKKSLKHWFTTERGGNETERYQLHGIVWNAKNDTVITKLWQYGFTFIGSFVNEKTVNYITKYITKTDLKHKNLSPIILCSAGIGENYLSRSDSELNRFRGKQTTETYRLRNGTKLNLPIYYRNKIYTDEEREQLFLNKIVNRYRDWETDRKSTRLNSSHITRSRMPSSA